jgi:hypothetical protein
LDPYIRIIDGHRPQHLHSLFSLRISDFSFVGLTELAILFGGDAGFPHQALDML